MLETNFNHEAVMEMDPFILLSTINTKLRNDYSSLNALCERYDINQSDLISKLGEFGYEYIGEINQFRMP
ncbi:DUF4250 domain-containing protein [Proteiniclasticum sp. SCR006]|uniref:DUF4250 domain-containing protein n=2 Tax=Proteiniclasticum aestuarii TaxID=2817862 RepID=A0A939H5I1_9CLOT|nr:DUF4250 domain-containing protein [Proteiniclasticum aestuarii]